MATGIQSKIVSVHAIKAQRGVEVQLHLLLTSALDGYSGVPRNFVRGGEVQQIQLRTDRTGIWRR